MKTNSLKKLMLAGIFTSAFLNVEQAVADIYFGPSVFLGSGSTATDVYGITCPIDTVSVRAQVGNKLGGFAEFISVQIVAPNGRAVSANSRENSPSPIVSMSSYGPGNYLVTVHKASSFNAEPYDINMDCYNKNGVAFVGTQSGLLQNQ